MGHDRAVSLGPFPADSTDENGELTGIGWRRHEITHQQPDSRRAEESDSAGGLSALASPPGVQPTSFNTCSR